MPFFALFRRKKRTSSFRRSRRPRCRYREVVRHATCSTSACAGPPRRGRPPHPQFAFVDSPSTVARLCTQTRDRVRDLLYAEPTLTSARQINLFLRTVKRAPDLARRVTRLRLDGGLSRRADDEHAGRSPLTTRLAKVLELCSALEALELRRVVVFSLTDFANARQLRHLAIVDSLVSDRTTTSRFTPFFTPLPSLETLAIENLQIDGPSAAQFLSAHTMPKLRALSLEDCRLVDDPVTLRDLGAHSPVELAPQLELLSVSSRPLSDEEHRRDGVVDPFDLVERCGRALAHLALPVAALTAPVLDTVDRSTARPQRLEVVVPGSTRLSRSSDPFEPHLVAAQALSAAFLALATSSTTNTAPATASSSPTRRPSPLAMSASAPPSLFGVSAPGAPSFLGGLAELVLPVTWDRSRVEAWKGNGEFDWAVARVVRECERRGTAQYSTPLDMAPRASTSRAQRSPSASSDDNSRRRQRNHKQTNGRQHASDDDSEDDNAAQIAALDLKEPLKTCRHLFLQALIARKTLSLDTAKTLYEECVKLCSLEGPPPLENFVAQLEPGLSLCGFDIKTTRDQETGTGMYILVNTIQDEPAKLATEYKAEEIAFFKAVVEKIMLAPRLSYSVSQTDAVRCAKQPLTKTVAIQLVKSLLAKGWLSLHSSGRLTLSPRSLVELAPYLRETFAQDAEDDDDDASDPRHRVVVDCNDCLSIVTSGYACPNATCGVRLHTFCVTRRLGTTGQCPDHFANPTNPCKQIWPRDPKTRKFHGVPVGVAALGRDGDDDDEESVHATSESATPAQRARKGEGKEGSGKGKGQKRGRAQDDDDDDDEDDSEGAASRAETSPASTRKSSRGGRGGKKKVAPPVSEDEDEDEDE
ncbi:hypothetical protein JCM8208_002308 [Rhodotorula glutinis]